MNHSRVHTIASWTLRLIAAGILVQTLFFKFTAAQESVYIFTTLGAEPWGRIGSGVVELVASILLLAPRTAAYGALLSLGTMGGAILSHLTKLGIALPRVGDQGELFALGVTVFACSGTVLWLHRQDLPLLRATASQRPGFRRSSTFPS